MVKTILITGSTDGIGKLTALKLAAEGHRIYLHGRNPQKLNETISEIKAATQNDMVDGFKADFSDLASVKEMAETIAKNVPEIDILINNAGIYNSTESHAPAGFELRFTVNYFAQIILTNTLLPLLKKGKSARIINLSSAAQSPVSIEALSGNHSLPQGEAYAQSKLAFTMWSFYLAGTLDNVTVTAVNPGSLLNTKMAKEAFGQTWSPAEKGVDILYSLALSDKFEGVTGKYFDNDKGNFAPAHPDAYNPGKIETLIQETTQILK